MSKKVIFIYERKLSELPPLLTLIHLVKSQGYSVTVTVSEVENQYLEEGVEQIGYLRKFKFNNKFTRLYDRKVIGKNFFRSLIPKIIKSEDFDLVWVIIQHSPDHIFSLKEDFSNGKRYYCTIYETFDTVPHTLEKIKPIAQGAYKVIVPEFNRAHILRSYLGLKNTPAVLPNKPLELPPLKDPEVSKLLEGFEGKKIILYQGHISRVRDIEAVCNAVDKLDNFVFVMMGKSAEGYAEELTSKYSDVYHVSFISPPKHLEFTSKAYIGIVTYGHASLNGVFCAPNKIWEYSGYGIPMICNDVPGLVYTVAQSKCGRIADFQDEDSIVSAIRNIEKDYDIYQKNAINMFESANLTNILCEILIK